MSKQDISRREVLKKGAMGLGAGGAATALGTGTAAASGTTSITVNGGGSGANYYKIRIENAQNAISGGGSNDSIYNNNGGGVIDGKVYSGYEDSYSINQNHTDLLNMDIKFVSVDGNIQINQFKGTESPLNGGESYQFQGNGSYRLETNYGNCNCGDQNSCDSTGNCDDVFSPDWNPGQDRFGRKDYYTYIDGKVTGGKDSYTVQGDVTYLRLDGNIDMQPW